MESCKLFIGGISWETTEDRLRQYFQNFGLVTEALIIKDRTTGRARGFGFIVFSDQNVADKVVLLKHIIDGKTVEAKKAVPRDDHIVMNRSLQGSSPGPMNSRKVFVGGLASSVTEFEFKNYFAQFGMITDAVVMYDQRTQRPRGFGFVSFDSEEGVDRVLMRSFHELNGKRVEVKLAVPKDMGLATPIRSTSTLLNEYIQSQRPFSPVVGNRGGGFSPFDHGFGIDLNLEMNQGQNYGRPFSPGRYGSQIEMGGGIVGNGLLSRNHLWGNGGGLSYMSHSPISRSGFSGSSGVSSLGSIGDNWRTVGRVRERGGLGLEAMRGGGGGVHVGGYSSGSSSFETDSLYSNSAWLSRAMKADEGLGIGALDFMSRGSSGYINRQPNGGIAA